MTEADQELVAGFATEYQAIAALRRAAAARRGAGGLGHAIGGTPVTEVIILGRGIATFGAFHLAVATHRGLAARGGANPTRFYRTIRIASLSNVSRSCATSCL